MRPQSKSFAGVFCLFVQYRQTVAGLGVEIGDHLLLDVTDAPVKLGDTVRFGVDYSAALRAFTSPYVEKVCK